MALERDEKFNTRISGYIGWEQAARKLIPTPRHAAQFDLTRMVLDSGSKTTGEAVDYLMWRMVRVPAAKATRDRFASFLTKELGTDSLDRAKTYMEDPLRMTVRPHHEYAGVSDRLTGRQPSAVTNANVTVSEVSHKARDVI